jgi:drug/metabolite transporter (DMT)-like permease
VGLLFAIGSPIVYTCYILAADRLMAGVPALAAGAVTLTGAAIAWTIAAGVTGHLRPPSSVSAWLILVGLAIIPTMIASTTFLAALPRIGGSRAALLSTWEPVVTVILAVVLLGDRLRPLQLFGGVLVLAAVGGLQWRRAGGDQPEG